MYLNDKNTFIYNIFEVLH